MKQLKNTIKNNILLLLAMCVAMSSTVVGCDSCNDEPEDGKNITAKVELTAHSGELKTATDVATVKVQKKEGELTFEDVILKFEGNANFTKDGETVALLETIKLSEFLKKSPEEEMGDTKHELKFKVISPLPAQDATLKLSVGNRCCCANRLASAVPSFYHSIMIYFV